MSCCPSHPTPVHYFINLRHEPIKTTTATYIPELWWVWPQKVRGGKKMSQATFWDGQPFFWHHLLTHSKVIHSLKAFSAQNHFPVKPNSIIIKIDGCCIMISDSFHLDIFSPVDPHQTPDIKQCACLRRTHLETVSHDGSSVCVWDAPEGNQCIPLFFSWNLLNDEEQGGGKKNGTTFRILD